MQVQPINAADRPSAEGVEVMAGAPVLLIHCATQAPLCLEEDVKYPNDFGIEREVSVHAAVTTAMQQGLEHLSRVGVVTKAACWFCCCNSQNMAAPYASHAAFWTHMLTEQL